MTSPFTRQPELLDVLPPFAIAAIVASAFDQPEDNTTAYDMAEQAYPSLVYHEGDDRAYKMVWDLVAYRFPDYESGSYNNAIMRLDRILIGC